MSVQSELNDHDVCWLHGACVKRSNPHPLTSETLVNGAMLAYLEWRAADLKLTPAEVAQSVADALDGDPSTFNLIKGVPDE